MGGKDVELLLWDTTTGELLSTLRGHETSWTSSNDNSFFVTTQEDSKVWEGGACTATPLDCEPLQASQQAPVGQPDSQRPRA